ncbi:MAG: MFS transporter, partial [bacterium]|nr:MFS transporter [bacterium]
MILKRIKEDNTFQLIILLTIAMAIGFQGWRTLINNFAVNNVGINGFWIGIMQSVREIPGFLSLLVIYITIILSEYKIISFSTIILGIGVALTGFFPTHYGLVITTLIMSVGFHYFETTRQSLVLQNFEKADTPSILGSLNSISAAVNIVVGGAILILANYLSMKSMFLIIGIIVIILAFLSLNCKAENRSIHTQHKKMILRKKYWLFYVLNFLAGARRQIFVVFAVFLLVKHYRFSIELITALFIINNVVNIYAATYIGKKIKMLGEKKVLVLGYIILFFIFISYAVFDNPWI